MLTEKKGHLSPIQVKFHRSMPEQHCVEWALKSPTSKTMHTRRPRNEQLPSHKLLHAFGYKSAKMLNAFREDGPEVGGPSAKT
jgi:hypothetical protein